MTRHLSGIIIILTVFLGTLTVFAQGYGADVYAYRLAFISERDNNQEIYIADVRRGLLLNVTRHQAADTDPQWSPDGTWIHFSSGRGDGRFYLLNTITGEIIPLPAQITNMNTVYRAVWSPDGTRLAYRSNNTSASTTNPVSFNFHIYHVVDGRVGMTDTPQGWEFGGTNIINGMDNSRRVIVLDIHGFPRFADVRSEDFGTSGLIQANSFTQDTLRVSPDGSQIVYADNSTGDMEIYVSDGQAGTIPRNLSDHPSADMSPVWSADGRYIAFISHRDGNSEVYVVDVESGDIVNMSTHRRRDYSPVFAP